MERQQYVERCSELFEVGGHAAVRTTAEAGLKELGPDPDLFRWLGQAHAAEDEDDHDTEAEAAYRQGLALAPDDLGLLVSYLELCLRSDSFTYPGRSKRAVDMQARIEELAPPGSSERRRVDDAVGWAGRGYWDDLKAGAAMGRLQGKPPRNRACWSRTHCGDPPAASSPGTGERTFRRQSWLRRSSFCRGVGMRGCAYCSLIESQRTCGRSSCPSASTRRSYGAECWTSACGAGCSGSRCSPQRPNFARPRGWAGNGSSRACRNATNGQTPRERRCTEPAPSGHFSPA